jgi:hypothetical protein
MSRNSTDHIDTPDSCAKYSSQLLWAARRNPLIGQASITCLLLEGEVIPKPHGLEIGETVLQE